jgi:bifunctional non-homologous end joining protein LigD
MRHAHPREDEMTRSHNAQAAIAGIPISHPDRLIYPASKISKIDLARYFESISEWILPHVKGRPLTLLHCPAGIASPCHYLKHAKQWGPSVLRRVRIQEKTKVGEYLIADTLPAVVALAQMGIVEIHTWNATDDRIERPNRIVWDLDPGPDVTWEQITTAAVVVRDVLKTLGLSTWVKTTGGRGIHVVAPVIPERDWSECLAFARAVAEAIERTDTVYTTTFAKAGRERRILIDYLRNNRTNTSVCGYSPRARPGAHVSVPLTWRELRTPPSKWTMTSVRLRLKRLKADPWAGYWTCRQRIADRALKAVRRV